MPEELWMEVCNIVQEMVTKTIHKKKKCNKAKQLSEEGSQIAEKRRETKGKGEKKRYTYLNAEFQRIARKDKKAFLSENAKNWRKTVEWEWLEIYSRKLDAKGTFHSEMGTVNDRSGMDLTEAQGWQEYTQNYTKKIFMTQITTMM